MKFNNAKTKLLIGVSMMTTVLAGCADPMPGDAITEATKHCLDAGGTPQYFHNGGHTTFTCTDAHAQPAPKKGCD